MSLEAESKMMHILYRAPYFCINDKNIKRRRLEKKENQKESTLMKRLKIGQIRENRGLHSFNPVRTNGCGFKYT